MKIWKTEIKVRSYELDSFGHVNNGAYASYLEVARCDYLEQICLSFNDFHRLEKFPVIAHVEIDYRKPAYFGDILTISAKTEKMTEKSITLAYEIHNSDSCLIAEAKTVMVFVNSDGKPTIMPDVFRNPFTE